MNTQEASTKMNAVFFHLRRLLKSKYPKQEGLFVSMSTTVAITQEEEYPIYFFHIMPSPTYTIGAMRAVEFQLPDPNGEIGMALHSDYTKVLNDTMMIVISCPIDTPAEELANDIYSYLFHNKAPTGE